MPTTSSSARAVRPALLVLVAAGALLTGAGALAGPALAIEDPRRPTAEVTHGPSCGPGVVRVAVVNGTEPRRVVLVFDGVREQDSADLRSGEEAELTSADVAWGTTVDVSVTVTAVDGTVGRPLDFGTYTRPSAADCAAVTPSGSATGQPSSADPSPSSTATAEPGSSSSTGPTSSRPGSPAAPEADQPASAAPAPGTPGSADPTSGSGVEAAPQAGSASAASVAPGGVVRVRATGFTPGEPVTVSMLGVDDPLTTVTAGGDGSVEAVVQIPRGAALGTATVQLVGGRSAAATDLDLQVAARSGPVQEQATSVPVLAAGSALIGVAGVLGLTAARRSRGTSTTTLR